MDSSRNPIAPVLSAIESGRTDRTVTLEGTDLHLRYTPEPGIDMRIEGTDPEQPGAAAVSTVFDVAAERPASYPPGLPYLPGLKVSVLDVPDRAFPSAMWLPVDDLEPALAEILAQSEAAGWAESTDSEGPPPPGLRMLILARPGARRTVIVGTVPGNGTIMVMDSPGDG